MIENLQPQKVFYYFEKICSIPHGSGNTGKISDYLVDFANRHDLRSRQDESGNVIIWKDGTGQCAQSEPVILQGHMDMVCEKEPSCTLNMEQDGLQLKLEDGIISAEGTTLGGDDGIAVAYCLALLADPDIEHPPLECVFTVDEEIGMLGAAALDCGDLQGKKMLNMDSEEEGIFLVSCAGGATATITLPVMQRIHKKDKQYGIHIRGLQGGHSGTEIDKGLANASVVLGRVLAALQEKAQIQLICIQGGKKDNAIPREAEAFFTSSEREETLRQTAEEIQEMIRSEYRETEPQMEFVWSQEEGDCRVMGEEDTKKVITLLRILPAGVQKMSREIEGLVQTSLNLGVLESKEDGVSFCFSVRSSVESEKQELLNRLELTAQAVGASVVVEGAYPAWEYREDSPVREAMLQSYREQYGREPVVQAIHAGVECGLFAGKIDGLDCVSFGPDMQDIHTTRECMDVASVQRTWKLLLRVLQKL